MAGVGYRIADGYLEIVADTDKADRQILQFFRSTDGRLRDMKDRFASEGNLAGRGFAKELERGAGGGKGGRGGGLFSGILSKMAGFGQMAGGLFVNGLMLKVYAGLGALPAALSAAASLAQGAVQMGGAVAALAPAAIGAAALAIGTLKMAFSGFGDALSAGLAGDMDKFAEATKNMAPAMREVVGEVVKLNPQLKSLKTTVQSNFWTPMIGEVTALGSTYLPMLQTAMGAVASAFGQSFAEIGKFLTSGSTVAAMGAAFGNLSAAVSELAAGLPGIVQGFLILFQVGASFMPGLVGGFSQLTAKFAEWMQMLADTGRLQAFISGGLSMIGDLIGLFTQLGGIVKGIFGAVPDTGSGLLGLLVQLATAANTFINSFQGQEILSTFFDKLAAIGQIAMQLVGAALPGLMAFSGALVDGLRALLPAAAPVGAAIGAVLSALAPLLPVLGNLAALLLTFAAGTLQMLATALGPIIKLFSDLASTVLPMLMPVLTTLMSAVLPQAVQWFSALADALAPIIPPLIQIAQVFVDQLLPVLPQLTSGMQPVRDAIVELVKAFVPLLLQIMPGIIANIPIFIMMFRIVMGVIMLIIPWVVKFIELITGIVTAFQSVLPIAQSIFGFFVGVKDAIVNFVTGAWDAIVGFFTGLIGWFAALPGRIWEWLSTLPTMIGDAISQMQERGLYMIGFFVGSIVKFFMDLPGQIWAFLSGLPSMIGNAFSSAWEWAKNATSSAINAVVGFVSSLPTRAAGILGGLWGAISGAVNGAWNSLKSSASNAVNGVVTFVQTLPSRIRGIFSGAIGWLSSAGADMVRGLANGIEGMMSWAVSKARAAASRIAQGFKDALGIGSPSKVMAKDVGRWIPPGIQQGIQAAMPALTGYVEGAARGLTSAATAPVVSVAAPNVSVGGAAVTLLVDGEEIAAKIVTPTRVAAATAEGSRQRSYLNTGRPAVVGGAAA